MSLEPRPAELTDSAAFDHAGGLALSWEDLADGGRRCSQEGNGGGLVRTETMIGAGSATAMKGGAGGGALPSAPAPPEKAAAAMQAAEEAGTFDVWKLASSPEASKARRQLCRVLRAMPLTPILGSSWDSMVKVRSWRGHSCLPEASLTAFEGLGLPSGLVRSNLSSDHTERP